MCVISNKWKIKTSHVKCSQTQRDDLESTVLHGTVLILGINEAELQHNLFLPPPPLVDLCAHIIVSGTTGF